MLYNKWSYYSFQIYYFFVLGAAIPWPASRINRFGILINDYWAKKQIESQNENVFFISLMCDRVGWCYTSSEAIWTLAFKPSPPGPSSSMLAAFALATSSSSLQILVSCLTITAFNLRISSANSCSVLSYLQKYQFTFM